LKSRNTKTRSASRAEDHCMNPQDAVDLGREALVTTMLIGAPILLVGLAVGLGVGLLQALTQVQDQTVAFVPKLLAMGAAVVVCLPWLLRQLMDYAESVITNIPHTIFDL
jgi:flagellar biosynthetic protein FliQ